MIKLNNVTKIFDVPSGTVAALQNATLNIEKGDIFGIIGMSGAGKTTLMRCIGMLETPTEGTIEIDGVDVSGIKDKKRRELRRKIGIIFQGYNLLMQKTVFDNVAFGMEIVGSKGEQIKSKVNELLELVGLAEKADAYPSQLSGGQKQRVAIARALAVDPQVLLCDEPTSALDSFTTKSILSLLKDINRRLGVTIIIITHEIGVVKTICNKVAVIDNSRFVEIGETSEIFGNPQQSITKLLLGIEVVG